MDGKMVNEIDSRNWTEEEEEKQIYNQRFISLEHC